MVEIRADVFTIGQNGIITGVGAGYGARSGTGWSGISDVRASASHGGGTAASWPGTIYGSMFQPATMGSGGYAGAGGAALHLDADKLVLNGQINMNGAASFDGAGAGGSAYITTRLLEGSTSNAKITARGGSATGIGNHQYYGYYTYYHPHYGGSAGGGGGRIALYCDESTHVQTFKDFKGVPLMEVFGGDSGGGSTDRRGGSGTIFVDCGTAHRALVIDGNGLVRTTQVVDDGTTSYS